MEKDLVLIVDDNEDTLNLLLMGVDSYSPSFVLDTAHNAKEATEKISKNRYNAVILDVSLPDITGATLGELIRKHNPDLPIAFLTNYNGSVTHEHAKSIGAHFWYKPEVLVTFQVFSDHVCALLSGAPCEEGQDSGKISSKETIDLPESLSNFIK